MAKPPKNPDYFRSTPFAVTPEWVLCADISDKARTLYAVLQRFQRDNDNSWPSRQTLADHKALKCSVRTIDAAIADLKSINALHVEERYRPSDGGRTSSVYTLFFDDPSLGHPPAEYCTPPSNILHPPLQNIAHHEGNTVNETQLTTTSSSGANAPRPGKLASKEVVELCDYLASRIVENGSKPPTVTKKWLDEMRLLIERDGRTPTQVRNMIDWCQSDPFWKSNILSAPKLRAKYDQMRLRATSEAEAATKRSFVTKADLAPCIADIMAAIRDGEPYERPRHNELAEAVLQRITIRELGRKDVQSCEATIEAIARSLIADGKVAI